MDTFLLLLALVGHCFLWVGVVNRLHSFAIRRRIIKLCTLVMFCFAAFAPLAVGAWYLQAVQSYDGVGTLKVPPLLGYYLVMCCLVALITLVRFVVFRGVLLRRPALVRFHGRRRADIDMDTAARDASEMSHHWVTRLPFNEILQLEVSQWMLDVPRLPAALNGLSIVHLSDLHLIGRVGKAYFREVVRTANELRPDLVCVTGDIVERTHCLDWIADTLGQLRARHGVYFVLGNHDRRVNNQRLRRTLEESGLIAVGDRTHAIQVDGATIELVGNERPWFGNGFVSGNGHWKQAGARGQEKSAMVGLAALGPPYRSTDGGRSDTLRIALAHTPDQLPWARCIEADLLLVGHTHGGQIRIPPLGAIFSPTISGVKYISGIYHVPPTILHVSRGVSADLPVRWNCRPEIGHLRLRVGCTASTRLLCRIPEHR